MFKEFFFKVTGILGFVLTLNGFLCSFLGIIIKANNLFLGLSLTTFGIGMVLVLTRINELKQRQALLTSGITTSGTITHLEQNKKVRVNRKHPWLIQYQYQANNSNLQGNDIIMDLPANYSVGKTITVVYSQNNSNVSRIKL
jgi:hypothetical protein